MRLLSSQLALWVSATSTSSAQYSGRCASRSSLTPVVAFLHKKSMTSTSTQLAASSSSDSMSSSLRVALCQFHVSHEKEENHKTAQAYLTRAKEKGAQLAVLPEIWNSPYATSAFPLYAEKLPCLGDTISTDVSSKILMEAATRLKMWIVGGSIPERVQSDSGEDKIYNTCLVVNPSGEIVAKHRKMHMFDIDVPGGITFFESETLSAGQTVSHFSHPVGEIGVGICYDIRFAEYAMLLTQKHKCSILIYPGAFNMTTGPAHWELLQRSRALDNQCYVLTASPARSPEPTGGSPSKYPHYTAWGHSTVVSPWGQVIATTDEKEGIVMVDLDLNKVEETRKSIPISDQKRDDIYKVLQV